MRIIVKNILLFALAACQISCYQKEVNEIDLSGKWKFRLDSLNQGIVREWYNKKIDDSVMLPGSLAENGKGKDVGIATEWTGQIVDSSWFTHKKYAPYRKHGNIKIPFWLQPIKHYVGAAWYQKEIVIGSNWSKNSISLLLERCHWETQVWIDGKKAGVQNSLSTPHHYDLTSLLPPGRHTLTIRVDNSIKEIDPGKNSHSISDHTQSNWNGIVGNIKLEKKPPVHIKRVHVFPDIQDKKATIDIWIANETKQRAEITLNISAESLNAATRHEVALKPIFEKVGIGTAKLSAELDMGEDVLLWDEFTPNLYLLGLSLTSDSGIHEKTLDFGMREFRAKGTRFQINGRPLFLRGTLECSIFPITGYPSTDVKEWTRIFKTCKDYGLNHVRFHSHCPPEAAFIAADREGVYLQVECGSWANSGSSLGDGKPIDKWLYEEADRILEAYGNHPSFCLMAYGNEPAGNNQVDYLNDFVAYLKNKDDRRVYTGGAGWPYVEGADFYNHPGPRIQGWGQGLNSIINKEAPQTAYDFKEVVEKVSMPYVSHEIGQWCAYPNFKEMVKYTGVLEPKNFEIFQETLQQNGLGHLADSLLLASGKLQTLCYKADIEAALRTPGFAGFQLLDLHDFPGQGTALVGVLDAFWEEKGYVTWEEFSQFCNETVPLARMEKRVFRNTEDFKAAIEVAHFGEQPLESPDIKWSVTNGNGEQIKAGDLPVKKLLLDNCQKVGNITVSLNEIERPEQLHLNVIINGFSNGWDFWVFPEQPKNVHGGVHITNELNDEVVQKLNDGGSVLWSIENGTLSSKFGGDIKVGFSSIFWNTAWTMGQAPHTLGILCNPEHPALAGFPTEYHSNWQWWDAMNHGQAVMLDNFSKPVRPIVRIVDDWFQNRSLGLIFEARVGNGKIIVCAADILTNFDQRLEAQQLLHSLLSYMQSPKFDPKQEILLSELKNLKS
ncbi:MAG: beta-glucuronidase [Cytophagales bacterium]|nr:beta-glucuronidase [Cytophagales bacterium]